MYSYRKESSKALKQLLTREDSLNFVIALPPSGLKDAYLSIVKKAGAMTSVIKH